MENFTKGPWIAAETGEFNHMVCAVSRTNTVYAKGEVLGNPAYDAALIAAAPEMYEILSEIIANSSFNVEHSDASDKIELILAKARGEQ